MLRKFPLKTLAKKMGQSGSQYVVSLRPMSSLDYPKAYPQSKTRSNGYVVHEEDRVISCFKPEITAHKQAYIVNIPRKNKDGTEEIDTILIDNPKAYTTHKVICTTCPETHSELRKERPLVSGKMGTKDAVIKPGDNVIGQVRIDVFGGYGGGNPTTYIPSAAMREQIYPDLKGFEAASIDTLRANSEEIQKNGPRISATADALLIRDKSGKLKTSAVSNRAFVNSTIHRGEQKGTDGKIHPSTYYTPGASLKHMLKTQIVERPNGDTLQTISILANAEADVLCHWVLNAMKLLGIEACASTLLSEKGTLKTRGVTEGHGETLMKAVSMVTGTPFVMSTLTVHRGPDGEPKNIFYHSEGKTWPATESIIELSGPSGHRQYVIYDSTIPETSKWGDLTVAKLALPTMVHSDIEGSLQEDGLGEIEDKELKQAMEDENKKMRYTSEELKAYDVPWTMAGAAVMREYGIEGTDPRSRVTVGSRSGDFDYDQIKREHIKNDPGSLEFYYCGRAARILSEKLEQKFKSDPSAFENKKLKGLWEFVTSAIPNYEKMKECQTKYSKEISNLIKTPKDIKHLNTCVNWAKEAHEADLANKRSYIDNEPELPFSSGIPLTK